MATKSITLHFFWRAAKLVSCFAFGWASAAESNSENLNGCKHSIFMAAPDYRTAVALSGAQAFNDANDCPEVGNNCRFGFKPKTGTTLLIGPEKPGWVCSWWTDKDSEYVAWIPRGFTRSVQISSSTSIVGRWVRSDSSATIIVNKDLSLSGEATWTGEKSASGVVDSRFGQLKGKLRQEGKRFVIGDLEDKSDCAAELKPTGKILVVRDNEMCGSTNVRFDGVYSKVKM